MGYGPRMRWGLRTEAPPPHSTFLEAKTAPSGPQGGSELYAAFRGLLSLKVMKRAPLGAQGRLYSVSFSKLQLSPPFLTPGSLTRV